ncbi:MAG: hypothetical protein FWD37_05425 [Methanomassiliicoccaceae archaeon]|nr:hypothetical protein [Methanomassiliicoccaceae archaeon]
MSRYTVLLDHPYIDLESRFSIIAFRFSKIEDARRFIATDPMNSILRFEVGKKTKKRNNIYPLDPYHFNEEEGTVRAVILDKDWKMLETHIGGLPESKYEEKLIEQGKKKMKITERYNDNIRTVKFWGSMYSSAYCFHFVSNPFIVATNIFIRRADPKNAKEYNMQEIGLAGFNTLDSAKKYVLNNTIGLYRLNGQFTGLEAEILDNELTLLERIISGFPEAEYNEIKRKREKK